MREDRRKEGRKKDRKEHTLKSFPVSGAYQDAFMYTYLLLLGVWSCTDNLTSLGLRFLIYILKTKPTIMGF